MIETTTEATTESARRGRPRPQTTIDRDEMAYERLASAGDTGLSRVQLAETLGISNSHAYLTLYRLARGGRVSKRRGDNGYVWHVAQ